MADTKISALTAAGSALSTHEYAANESSVSKKVTGAQLKTLVNTAPVWAAGSASAASWPTLGSGTVLTTPEAGAYEYDGTAFYLSPAASSRAVNRAEYVLCLSGTYTLANSGSAQKLFNLPTNGALTLPTGLYFFDCMFSISSMSATSGNLAFDVKGGGGATIGSVLYHAVGVDGNTATAATQTGSTTITTGSAASIVTAATGTVVNVNITGTFRCTGTGTIIPSVTLVTAVGTAVVAVGSFFRCWCAGGSAVTTVGNWA